MDFITSLPTYQAHSVIVVIIDRLSKAGHFGRLPLHFLDFQAAEHFSKKSVNSMDFQQI